MIFCRSSFLVSVPVTVIVDNDDEEGGAGGPDDWATDDWAGGWDDGTEGGGCVGRALLLA